MHLARASPAAHGQTTTPMPLPSSSFAILGAGLMGRMLAVELARQGHAVDIYDAAGPAAEQSAADWS